MAARWSMSGARRVLWRKRCLLDSALFSKDLVLRGSCSHGTWGECRSGSGFARTFSSNPQLSGSLGPVTWKGRRKFYKEASVGVEDGGFVVLLDGRALRTPASARLLVPSRALGLALAHEWNMQGQSLEPSSMPLMTLTCSAIDTMAQRKTDVIEELLRFLQTDTLCYFQPQEKKLFKKQKEIWRPLHRWAEELFGSIDVSHDMSSTNHPEETVENLETHLNQMDLFKLTAVESVTHGCKSVLIALALAERQITVEEAISAARLEEEHQIEEWGMVEGGHDIDRANLGVQVAAASTFLWLQ